MAILKFRVYLEEDDAVYRDIAIKHTQYFLDLHLAILKAYEFDNKHQATFYRSNDAWQRGREISLAVYEKSYVVTPLLMADTTIGSEVSDPNQKFIYVYDFDKNWFFLVALIQISKEENVKLNYPAITRVEGIGPQQYGTKSLLGEKFTDIEEKFDLTEARDGFGEESDEADSSDEKEENTEDAEGRGLDDF
ncbi:hypothetical protein [Hydrotalea sp.]|uniref:IS1096 element passenger TnpR family protein n=1 Tax=Hydrotalea sp. TaxID=2881279 RepID=UPI00260C2D06|nr:hypothetical protein [Hydrotalea sp.]